MRLLCELVIKDFPKKVQIADKRRARYYNRTSNIPKKYLTPDYNFDSKGILIKKSTGEKIIANPKTAGQPRFVTINGQGLYNGTIHPMTRNKVTAALHKFFTPYLEKLSPFTDFPLVIAGEMFRPLDEKDCWDMDNIQGPYVKAFHDVMKKTGLIPDDKAMYINGPLSFLLTPSDEEKFVIRFYHDDRLIWKNYGKPNIISNKGGV